MDIPERSKIHSTNKGSVYIGSLLAFSTFLTTVFLMPTNSVAQDFTGMRGTVRDESGAVLVGVTVTAVDQERGHIYSDPSNEVGHYELRGLLPGTYTMTAELAGFKKYENRGVIVYVRKTRRVDITLEIGPIDLVIDVEAEGYRIETDTPTIRQTTAKKEMVAFDLGAAVVYAVGNSPGWEVRSQVHGGYANNLNAEQDGMPANSYAFSFRPGTETTQEIIQTSLNAPAEYRTSTTVTGVGRGGTNKFHGEIFYHLDHPRLHALGPNQPKRLPASPDGRWSYEAGGPVYIPGLYDGRDKSFFHFVFQPLSFDGTGLVIGDYSMPTDLMRQGDLSEFSSFSGQPILNPFTDQPFPNNVIPDDMISPVAKKAVSILPRATRQQLAGNFDYMASFSNSTSPLQLRFDHQLSELNHLTFSLWYHSQSYQDSFGPLPNADFMQKFDARAFSFQDSHIFSPQVMNEFVFGYTDQDYVVQIGDFSGREYLKLLGITDLGGREKDLSNAPGNPHFRLETVGRSNLLVGGGGFANSSRGHIWQIRDNVSVHQGNHLIKTGLEVRKQFPHKEGEVAINEFGSWNFTDQFTGYDYGDFLLGLPFDTKIERVPPTIHPRAWEVGFFLQDEWKLRPDLTLNLGVRFQHYGEPFERDDRWYNFDLETQRVVVPNEEALAQVIPGYPIPVVTAREAGYPDRLVNFKFLMAEPRFGFAWRPWQGSVIRSGYGIYHVPYARHISQAADNPLRHEVAHAGLLWGRVWGPYQLGEVFGPNRIVNGVPELTLERGFPPATGQIGQQDVYAMDPDLRKDNWPYDQQWNLTLEQELGRGFALRASYVGAKGTQWPVLRNLNQPPASTIPFDPSRQPFGPMFNTVGLMDLGGNSNHHGIETELSRQFSSGLYLLGWVQYVSTLNDVPGGTFGSTVGDFIEDAYDRKREKGYQGGNRTQDAFTPFAARVVAVYPLPIGRGQRYGSGWGGFLNHVLGHWTVAPHFRTNAGSRWDAFVFGDTAKVGRPGGRPDLLPGCDPNSGEGFFPWRAECFMVPANGRFGTAPRGVLRLPTEWFLDFNAFKRFNLGYGEGGPYFQVETYINNLFNHRNLGTWSNNIRSPFFRAWPWGNRAVFIRLRIGI